MKILYRKKLKDGKQYFRILYLKNAKIILFYITSILLDILSIRREKAAMSVMRKVQIAVQANQRHRNLNSWTTWKREICLRKSRTECVECTSVLIARFVILRQITACIRVSIHVFPRQLRNR